MNEEKLKIIVDAWIAGENAEEGTPEREQNWWAISQVMDWSIDGESKYLWQFILAAYGRRMSEKAQAVFAAGPLEDLLAKDGESYIAEIEELAKADEKFNYLLGGVWRNSMSDDVWARVQEVRKQVW